MSADLLRRAAAKLREHAEAATPGPWLAEDDGEIYQANGEEEPEVGWAKTKSARNAPYIALMHPPVALAIAELLDNAVAMISIAEGFGQEVDYKDAEPLLKLARAVLRTALDEERIEGDQK